MEGDIETAEIGAFKFLLFDEVELLEELGGVAGLVHGNDPIDQALFEAELPVLSLCGGEGGSEGDDSDA